jgi:hypothetical protein
MSDASTVGAVDAEVVAAVVGGVVAGGAAVAVVAVAGPAAAVGVAVWRAVAVVGLAAATQTPTGEGGEAGMPAAGTYRNPSASPSVRVSDEMPMLESCHAPPPRDTKIAQ